jgi:hypothetical protein
MFSVIVFNVQIPEKAFTLDEGSINKFWWVVKEKKKKCCNGTGGTLSPCQIRTDFAIRFSTRTNDCGDISN